MSPIFIDTSYLIALLRTRDVNHSAAAAARRLIRPPFVTTQLVLVELLDSMSSPRTRSLALAAAEAMRDDPETRVMPLTEDVLDAGLALYRSRPDKDWGLTDCISFAVMQREGITDALTADRHFEQAGFRALLRSSLQ